MRERPTSWEASSVVPHCSQKAPFYGDAEAASSSQRRGPNDDRIRLVSERVSDTDHPWHQGFPQKYACADGPPDLAPVTNGRLMMSLLESAQGTPNASAGSDIIMYRLHIWKRHLPELAE